MKPPGFTCPAIDRTLHLVRAIEWRVRRGERLDEVPGMTREAVASLEELREVNRQLREWGRSRVGQEPPVGAVGAKRPTTAGVATTEKVWLAELAAAGVPIAHPDDGWVDREANTILLVYPRMMRARPAVGVRMALGDPARYRIVVLTREVPMPIGESCWAFDVEDVAGDAMLWSST